MDAHELAHKLDAFSKAAGWEPPERVFIRELRCTAADGDKLYADAGMDWCRPCAEKLVQRFLENFVGPLADPPEIETADPSMPDDTPAFCEACGETLDHTLTEYGVSEEVAHYTDNPITDADMINRRQAFELSCLLSSAPGDPEVQKIAAAALAAIEAGRIEEDPTR